VDATVVVITAALIAAGGTVAVAIIGARAARRQVREARRQASGNVEASEAATLWEAAEKMRLELRAEVIALRAQAVELLAKIDRLEARLRKYEGPPSD
jgi:hypothetical protein